MKTDILYYLSHECVSELWHRGFLSCSDSNVNLAKDHSWADIVYELDCVYRSLCGKFVWKLLVLKDKCKLLDLIYGYPKCCCMLFVCDHLKYLSLICNQVHTWVYISFRSYPWTCLGKWVQSLRKLFKMARNVTWGSCCWDSGRVLNNCYFWELFFSLLRLVNFNLDLSMGVTISGCYFTCIHKFWYWLWGRTKRRAGRDFKTDSSRACWRGPHKS